MIGGLDRYVQIARCFRDEDLRADRQPEFTQIDVEMSFVDENDVMQIHEGVMKKVFKDVLGKEISVPFRRMPYQEAMQKYGSDKPDLRNTLQLVDLTAQGKRSEFQVYQRAIEAATSSRVFASRKRSRFPAVSSTDWSRKSALTGRRESPGFESKARETGNHLKPSFSTTP